MTFSPDIKYLVLVAAAGRARRYDSVRLTGDERGAQLDGRIGYDNDNDHDILHLDT